MHGVFRPIPVAPSFDSPPDVAERPTIRFTTQMYPQDPTPSSSSSIRQHPSTMATPVAVTQSLSSAATTSRGAKAGKRLLDTHPDMVSIPPTPSVFMGGLTRPTTTSLTPKAGKRLLDTHPDMVPIPLPPTLSVFMGGLTRPTTPLLTQDMLKKHQMMLLACVADKEYARLVSGCTHARTLSSVWGPRDGSGLNAVDTRRLQQEVYRQIIQGVDDDIASNSAPARRRRGDMTDDVPDDVETTIPPVGDTTTHPPGMDRDEQVYYLASAARRTLQSFNDGWDQQDDVGIINEVVSTEMEVFLMLKQVGVISPWDQIMMSSDPILQVRLLRRHPKVSACFAAAVGAAMVASAQSRPTVRPTRFIMQQTSSHAAVQFQILINCLHANRSDLIAYVREYHTFLKKHSFAPIFFADYNEYFATDQARFVQSAL